ncbi:MAG: OmpA family protein [Candidatus Polarisedimenticolia bacterium]
MTTSERAMGTMMLCLAIAAAGCTAKNEPYTTSHDKTGKGAAIGAGAGAVLGAILGEGQADDILKGAAIGGGIGAGVGAYMDRQEEKLARIPGTSVERAGKDTLLVHFDSDILFGVDSAVLSGAARASLNDAAGVFLEYPKTAIVVQGHTDSTGSEEHNQSLSERRAQAVAAHLIGRGVEDDRLATVGYGEGNPIANNGDPEGRSRNRRVDLLLKAKAR